MTDLPPTSPPRRIGGWKLHAARTVLLLGTLVFLLGLLEVGTRLFTATTPPLTEKDGRIGQRHIQNFAGDVFDLESGRKVHLRFNADGFRGPDVPRTKPPGVRRVAVLGDSMISALAVEEGDTLVRRLEQLLNAGEGPRWQVLNFGVAGASPAQQLALYEGLVREYRPDIVLGTYFVGNDFSDNSARLSNNPRIYYDLDAQGQLAQLPFSAERAGLSRWLNRYSRFYVWQKHAINRACHHVAESAGMIDPGRLVFRVEEDENLQHAWKISTEIPRMMADAVRRDGGQFALVMIPSASQVCDDYFAAILAQAGENEADFDQEKPDRRLAEVCRDCGIPFLSMLDDFRAAAPSRSTQAKSEWLFLNGVGHFNERGNRLAAEVVHRFLREEGPVVVAARDSAKKR